MNETTILVKRSILMGEVYEWRKKHTNEKYTDEKIYNSKSYTNEKS